MIQNLWSERFELNFLLHSTVMIEIGHLNKLEKQKMSFEIEILFGIEIEIENLKQYWDFWSDFGADFIAGPNLYLHKFGWPWQNQ